ncbi:MAG: hypothetical protein NT007_09740 [Candidatus Kapabacteria bacterium]|nr:hypothetical protein [Candidatus Kapabacteria bacterium]
MKTTLETETRNTFESILNQTKREQKLVWDIVRPDKGYTSISSTPWIVASEDCFYSVTFGDDNKCLVDIDKTFVAEFSLKAANDIIQNFKVFNGNGKISWKMFGIDEFYQLKYQQLNEKIATIENLLTNELSK